MRHLLALALGLMLSASSIAAPTFYSSRADFLSQLSGVITDDYSNPGYVLSPQRMTDAAMSAVLDETQYQTTGFTDNNTANNIVFNASDPLYCAGCNGSFLLTFTSTSIGTDEGVFGVGFDVFMNDPNFVKAPNGSPGPLYTAFITFGDGSAVNELLNALVINDPSYFFGVTAPERIASIHIANSNTPTQLGGFVLDNLSIGEPRPTSTVPEPSSFVLLLAGALPCLVIVIRRLRIA